jgi:hypothetical protein
MAWHVNKFVETVLLWIATVGEVVPRVQVAV